MHLVGFTPAHQLFAAEAGIAAQHDAHLGPLGPQLGHDASDLIQRARRSVHVAGTKPRAQQLITGEDVERQVAVAVVISMKKALWLMAVERDVGRIQIEHNLLRRFGVRLDEQIAKQRVDLLRRVVDLVIALGAAGQLQPVQSALASQGFFQLAPARQHGHQRIVPQLLMIVQVLIPQRQPVNALGEHLLKLVLDQRRRPPVGEARRHAVQEVDLAIGLAQQQRPTIG